MPGNLLFISYSHRDMIPVDWLDRLKLYLAPLRRQQLVDIWADTRIEVGHEWRLEIRAAMDRASAAILLVGPGFLASDFIAQQELPALLAAAATRGIKIYPLVVGFCGYKSSPLEHYQAFNNPDMPLEALTTQAEQNRILNNLSRAVEMEMLKEAPRQPAPIEQPPMTGWQCVYTQEYNRTEGYMLVHVYRPSTGPGQEFDVFIFVVRHRRGTEGPPQRNFDEIQKAEFFFGPGWGNKIFPVDNTDDLIGVRTQAWGTFFAACRLTFTDPNRDPISLYRYVDFEMGPQST
jgi:TIR domain